MYASYLTIIILVIIVLFLYNCSKQKSNSPSIIKQNNSKPTSLEKPVKVPEQNNKDKHVDTKLLDTNRNVNYIGGNDIYKSLPVSLDKTGLYSFETGCKNCKKFVKKNPPTLNCSFSETTQSFL